MAVTFFLYQAQPTANFDCRIDGMVSRVSSRSSGLGTLYPLAFPPPNGLGLLNAVHMPGIRDASSFVTAALRVSEN